MGVPVLVRRWRRRPLLRDAGDGHDLHRDVRSERCPRRPGGGVRVRCGVGVGCRGFVGPWKRRQRVGGGVELVRAIRVGVELRRCERLGDGGRCGSLDLTSGMTVEAWVRPSKLGGWRTVVVKEPRAGSCTGWMRIGRRAAVGSGGHRRRAERRRVGGIAIERLVASGGHVRRGGRADVRRTGRRWGRCRSWVRWRRRPVRCGSAETASGVSGSRA